MIYGLYLFIIQTIVLEATERENASFIPGTAISLGQYSGGFILCQEPPSVHYSHFPHNGYVAFWLSVV